MSPFAPSQITAKPSLRRRIAARPALTVFLLCLVLGVAAVAWRAKARTDTARTHARIEALARGVAVELQFSQALTAAEVLGTLARQSSGAISNFQRVAGELLASRPSLAYLELQPGGVVSDIVPLAGHERAIGFNVLADPAHRLGASAAIQRRALTVAGPLKLYHGEPGIVVRVPVFQRRRDGRDYFWGFVAVSMRLPEALARAHVDELSAQGYSYVFFAAASTQQKAVTIAAHGGWSFQDAVEQPVRAENLEFRLAVRPRGGWVNKTKVTLDCLGVFLVSGFLCLLINILERWREGEARAADANRRLVRDTADRQADRMLAESQVRLEAMVRGANETSEAAQVRLKQAELRATELQTHLDAAVRAADDAAQARQRELEQAHAALQQAQGTINELQARLKDAVRGEKETSTTVQSRLQQNEAAIIDLKARLDAATRSARETAEANRERLNRAEESNQQMRAQLVVAEQAASRVAELTDLLQEAQSKLQRQQRASARSAQVPAANPVGEAPRTAKDIEPEGAVKRTKAHRDHQMNLFEQQPAAGQTRTKPAANAPAKEQAVEAPCVQAVEPIARSGRPAPNEPEKPQEDKPVRPLPAPPPVNPAELRTAVNQILPLLIDQDPGAKDCLKDNRATFRSAFAPEAYLEFEQFVKSGGFAEALEHLKRAAKKHGISV